MLDALIPNKDAEGYRLDAEGRRVTIIFELDQTRTTFLDMFELAIPMFQAVGIDAQMRTMDRSLWEKRVRRAATTTRRRTSSAPTRGIAAMLDPRYYVPINNNCFYAQGWHSSSPSRTTPTRSSRRRRSRRSRTSTDQLVATADPAGQQALMAQMLQNAADLFFTFGVSLPADGYGIVKNDMVNVLKEMPNSFGWPTPGPTAPSSSSRPDHRAS